jgi:hypothetical protein
MLERGRAFSAVRGGDLDVDGAGIGIAATDERGGVDEGAVDPSSGEKVNPRLP